MDLSHLDPATTTELALSDTGITDAGLAHLAGLTALKTLDLGRTAITDAGLVYLTVLKSLEWIDLSRTAVTRAGVTALRAVLPNCKVYG